MFELKTNKINLSEKDLIDNCKKGNRIAQKKVYDLYAGKMMGICLRYSKDMETAKDILHDGFLKIYSNLNKFRGEGSFEGWIRRIIVNTALEYLRNKKEEGYSVDIEEAFSLKSEDYNILNKLQTEEIIKIISELPDTYRIVFNLFTIDGFSHREIAEKLNISESSSRVYLTRAKKILQDRLAKYR